MKLENNFHLNGKPNFEANRQKSGKIFATNLPLSLLSYLYRCTNFIAMANEHLKIALKHDKARGNLSIVVRYCGGNDGRKRITVQGLVEPDFSRWDKKAEIFTGWSQMAKTNNAIIGKVKERCREILNDEHIVTTDDFYNTYIGASGTSGDASVPKTNAVETLGDYLRSLIDGMRNGTNNRLPSRNYQVYINLLHKLEREKRIIKVPLKDISNKHFIDFGEWLLGLKDEDGRCNYRNLMKLFKQVHTMAYDEEKNDNQFRFRYSKHAPLKEAKEKRPPLSPKQYRQFCSLDLSTVLQRGPNTEFYVELYHDFCMFLYETKSRPADVLQVKARDFVNEGGKTFWKYVPEKKKNYEKAPIVKAPLSDVALSIVKKYEGKSAKGYVFPFSMNNYDWDAKDAKSWNTWNNRKAHALQMVNAWLKKVQKKITDIDFQLTLYTFRASAFTHACNAPNANIMRIALEGGTSIKMLEQHYVTND